MLKLKQVSPGVALGSHGEHMCRIPSSTCEWGTDRHTHKTVNMKHSWWVQVKETAGKSREHWWGEVCILDGEAVGGPSKGIGK